MAKSLTTEEFILRAREKHGWEYDYSKVKYKNSETKVCIICHKHGEFWQTPYHHLNRGQGCPKCIGRNLTTDEFIKKAKCIHGNKYDYSKVLIEALKNKEKEKICIICPEHGEFLQTPVSHLNGCGCPKCGEIKRRKNQSESIKMPIEEFIKRAKEVHGDKYDYSKVEYNTTNDKICIICPKHGEFWQIATNHINKKNGCPKCHPNHKKTVEEFIQKAKEIHGDKYDYSKVEYVNNTTPVCIICPKHGEFWQRPNSHISRNQGCPSCAESKLENYIEQELKKRGAMFEKQKTFDDVKNKTSLRYDFYDVDNNTLIECQGIQHIRDCNIAFGKDYFVPLINRDRIKFDKANEKKIKLIYIVEKRYYKEFITFGGIYNKNNTIGINI